MGTLAMIAAAAPKNLLHVVIDNEAYESTGNQRSLSNSASLEKVAQSAGYLQTKKVTNKNHIRVDVILVYSWKVSLIFSF
jgi:pyruvate/2-oxoacid:ferredoxin oxidoreductase beta subunit